MELLDGNLTATQALIAGWIAAAFVQALPKPDVPGSKLYIFVYNFSHILAANWNHVKSQLNVGQRKPI